MADKLIACKTCGQMIAKNAKACPFCGAKVKKPIYKRWWFWVVVVLILLIAIGSGSGKSGKSGDTQKIGEVSNTLTPAPQSSETQETSTPAANDDAVVASSAPQEEVKTAYQVGDILQDGQMKIIYAASGVYQEENQFMQPDEGYKYIFLKLAFINESNTDQSISLYSFNAYADGYAADQYYGGEEDLSATLSAGRQTMGYLYFTVPVDAEEIEIEYETNFFTEKKINFIYEGEKDSGYQLEAHTDRKADAYVVGDVIEGRNVTITYLSCETWQSDNMFIQPKDGYHYVTLELEFENTGSSDRHISSFSFDCYADGTACDQTYSRDDDLSATLSAGRKVKGTVTFEVPDQCSVIEAEYNDNVWTSNRIVFTVK